MNKSEDVVYRQAALDTIAEMQIPIMRSKSETDQLIFKGLGMAWNAIDELDPAQLPEIIRCKDCKHRPIEKDGEIMPPKEDDWNDWKCPCLCDDYFYSWMPKDNFFCASGERKEE